MSEEEDTKNSKLRLHFEVGSLEAMSSNQRWSSCQTPSSRRLESLPVSSQGILPNPESCVTHTDRHEHAYLSCNTSCNQNADLSLPIRFLLSAALTESALHCTLPAGTGRVYIEGDTVN